MIPLRIRRPLAGLLLLMFALVGLARPASASLTQPPAFGKPRPGLDPLPDYRSALQLQNPDPAMAQAASSGTRWAYLVFESYRDGNWEIYLGDQNGAGAVRLTAHEGVDQSPKLDPTAARVVFVSDRDRNHDLYTINVDGSGLRALTRSRERQEALPAWSPDGQKIAFAARSNADNSRWGLFTMRADGSAEAVLTPGSSLDNLYPAWSPDGSRLVWVQADGAGLGRLWVMNADGNQTRPLSGPLPFLASPAWSPDGQRLAFDADMDGDGWSELGVIGADGQGLGMLYDPGRQFVDAWMGCWFRNGAGVIFSQVEYELYQDELYLKAAYVRSYTPAEGGAYGLVGDGVTMSPDFVSTDRAAPVLELNDLPEFSRAAGVILTWDGSDAGGSGIDRQQIQARMGLEGEWVDVFTGYASGPAYLATGQTGREVYYRARARDTAWNWGEWSHKLPHTTFYAWELTGRVRDARETRLPGAQLTIDPSPLNPVDTGTAATFRALLAGSGTYSIRAAYPGYTPLPALGVAVSGDRDYDAWMLLGDDLLVDGGFEAGTDSTAGWTRSMTVTVQADPRETGQYHALLGTACPVQPCLAGPQFVPTDYATAYSLAADEQGRLHLLMSRSGTPGIFYLARPAGGSWSQPELIPESDSGQISYDDTDLAIDAHGNLYAVWSYVAYGRYEIFYSQRPAAAGSWTTPIVLDQGSNPVIAADSRGGVYVGFGGTGTGGFYYRERLPSGVWQPTVWIDLASSWGRDLAIGPDDSLHLAWYNTGTQKVMYRVRRAGGSWGDTETLPLTSPRLSLLVDRQNSVHILSGSEVISRPAGEPWSAKQEVLPAYYDRAIMAVDRQGTLYLLYSHDFGDPHYLRVRRAGVWSAWGKITEDNITTSLAMETDPGGHIHIVEGPFYSGEWGFTYYTDRAPAEDSLHWIRQSVQIPASMNRPTLSFWYSLSEGSPDAASGLSVRLESESGAAEIFSTREQTGWKHAWVDLSPWAGQAVTVTFELQQAKGEFYRSAGLDDVSLGSWLTPVIRQVDPAWIKANWAAQVITLSGENLLPGVTVRVGNALAEQVERVDEFTLRVTLPYGLAMGNYDLWVTNPGGQSGALPGGLRLGRFLFLPVIHR